MVIELSRIKFVVGLGNPGTEYERTRHNAGFELIKLLLGKLPGSFEKFNKYNAINFRGRFRGQGLILQMPQTFMNLSGKAVAALAAAESILPSEILAVYDDIDIPLGRLRLRLGGSSGGHNGINSLIESLGSDSFGRLRLGIGEANQDRQAEYVLGNFKASEQAIFDQVLATGTDAVICALVRDLNAAMNSFNSWTLPEEQEPQP